VPAAAPGFPCCRPAPATPRSKPKEISRPITKDTGRVRAEARVVAQGRQIISAEARVTSADGKVLAHATSTLMVLAGVK
jgi:hypothetical protein